MSKKMANSRVNRKRVNEAYEDVVKLKAVAHVRTDRPNDPTLLDILTAIRGVPHVITVKQEGSTKPAPENHQRVEISITFDDDHKYDVPDLERATRKIPGVRLFRVVEYEGKPYKPEMQTESSVGQDLIAAVKEAIHRARTASVEPYRDNQITENVRIRRFSESVRDEDLVWHRDERDRKITVLEGRGWQFQRDNELPQEMRPGQVIEVRAGEWHRVIKGCDELVLTIKESGASLVSEDIVSIRRDGKDVLYDIEFDDGDRIVDYDPAPQKPEALLASESEQQAFEIVKRMTSAPDAQIIKTIQGLSAKDQVRKPWPGVEEGLKLMNASPEALETINWNPGKGVGRGEAALHLMFDTNPVVPEPDVVMRSGDGYSIKFFGSNGAGSVKAGEADPGVERAVSAVMSDLTQMSNSWDSDINILLAPKSGPSAVSLRDFLGSSLSNAEASDRVADFKRDLLDLRDKVINLLESIASEHDAEGIIAVTDQFSFVPAGNAEGLIELFYLRGSTRPQFGLGRPGKTRTNWLSVIDDTLKEA